MYETDSFFTLGILAQIGLLAVSAAFTIGMACGVRRLSRGRSVVVRIEIWAVLFYLFVWMSPQGYYAYYRLIFDGLPMQWVAGWPASLVETVKLLTFTGPSTISAHSLGAFGWALLILALWPQRSNCRNAAN